MSMRPYVVRRRHSFYCLYGITFYRVPPRWSASCRRIPHVGCASRDAYQDDSRDDGSDA